MSLFMHMTKSLAACITRNILPALGVASDGNANAAASSWASSFRRWQQFGKRSKANRKTYRRTLRTGNGGSSLPSLRRCRSLMRARFDREGLKSPAVLLGMRMARLFSLNSRQTLAAAPSVGYQPVRAICGRENCADPCYWPPCYPGNEREEFTNEKNKLFNIYEAYWDEKNDDCCGDPCKWAHPRFDDIYYRENDKVNRVYTRTWYECPEIVKQKRVCCQPGIPPDFCPRPRKERPDTACSPPDATCSDGNPKCPKIKDPCCCPAREKPVCKPLTRGLSNCKKFCTPYPSFSECMKPKKKGKRRIECNCLDVVPMCAYYEYWRSRVSQKSKC